MNIFDFPSFNWDTNMDGLKFQSDMLWDEIFGFEKNPRDEEVMKAT